MRGRWLSMQVLMDQVARVIGIWHREVVRSYGYALVKTGVGFAVAYQSKHRTWNRAMTPAQSLLKLPGSQLAAANNGS